jgi:hypothetical protein
MAFVLGRIRVRLATTSETVIALQLLVMNLERRLRDLFVSLMKQLFTVKFPSFRVICAL